MKNDSQSSFKMESNVIHFLWLKFVLVDLFNVFVAAAAQLKPSFHSALNDRAYFVCDIDKMRVEESEIP